jgi:hypothetical protein
MHRPNSFYVPNIRDKRETDQAIAREERIEMAGDR